MRWYCPDFEGECRICGTTPTVLVINHCLPETDLCGIHFWHDAEMAQWEDWNNETDDNQGDSE